MKSNSAFAHFPFASSEVEMPLVGAPSGCLDFARHERGGVVP